MSWTLNNDTKIYCHSKLHKAYKLVHSTSQVCDIKDISDNDDSDIEFLKSKAISRFLFPK